MIKKIKLVSLFFLLIILCSNNSLMQVNADEINNQTEFPSYSCVPRPNDVEWIVYTPNQTPVSVVERGEQISYFYKLIYNNLSYPLYESLVFLSTCTTNYNCHSYAWYSQDVNTNKYWMNYPSAYYTDGSYVEVESPQVGDKICYFSDKNTTTLYDDENIHSGIVVAVHDGTSNGVCGIANLVTVRSKWGARALYEHRGDECPYVETPASIQYFSEPPTGYADYIKFHRRHAEHTYTEHYEPVDANTHKAYCLCGEYITENHDYIVQQHNLSYHKKSCYCNKVIQEEHSFSNGQCVICNQCDHEYGYSYVNDTTCRATCYNCMFTTTQAHVFMIGNLDYYINCNATIDSGFGGIIHQGIINLVSLNGSYVLPNGNIVLVPEDKEAYYNGTLVFYNRNELPEVA